MKKLLLFASAAALAAGSINAFEPKVYEDEAFVGIAPDGQYAVSEIYGSMGIFDLVSGQKYTYVASADGLIEYSLGNGNSISRTGAIIGCTKSSGVPSVWEKGEWTVLNFPTTAHSAYANGITGDGNRIVGNVAPESYSIEGLMQQPCYWDRNEDGTWSDIHLLPFPNLDLTGRIPQYVTALSVSDDGKTIVGLMTDYGGNIYEPVLYNQAEDGSWSYTLLQHEKLFKPEGIVLPEYPGDGVAYPMLESFLSEEAKAQYYEAIEQWQLSGDDWDAYPNVEDFADEAAKAAYDAAMAEFNVWADNFEAFATAYSELIAAVPTFVFNNGYMSCDGRIFAASMMKERQLPDWSVISEYAMYLFDLQENTYKVYNSDIALCATDVLPDGTVLATGTDAIGVRNAFILPVGGSMFIPLEDYLASVNPEAAAWMAENMKHDMEVFNGETYEFETREGVMVSGVPFASDDLSVISCYAENSWDFDSDALAFSYLFSGVPSGVSAPTVGSASVKALAGGVLAFSGEVENAQVYDTTGRMVFSADAPAASVETGLAAGVYMVKVVATDASVTVAKVAF